jgi:cytochrome c oxidase assembly factor CtaG
VADRLSVGRRTPLAAAFVVTALVVSPPADNLTDSSLPWHMAQHLVLLGVVGPLLVLAAGPGSLRLRTSAAGTTAVAAALLSVVLVTAWHLPPLFDLAERSTPVHVVEHLSFIASSVLLWLAGTRWSSALATVLVFLVSLTGTALGAAMTFASSPWYAAYPSLGGQQLAGSLMWSVGGLATVACGVLSLVRLLTAEERAAAEMTA